MDKVNNEIFVANVNSITVYSLDGERQCRAAADHQRSGHGVGSADRSRGGHGNNEVLVANDSSITIYSRTASGNVAPLRTISGPSTGLMGPFGLAVDTVEDEVLVANFGSAPA